MESEQIELHPKKKKEKVVVQMFGKLCRGAMMF